MITKYDDRYLRRDTQGTSREIRDWEVRRRSPDDRRNRNWRDADVLDRQNDRRDNYRRFENRNPIGRDDRGFESHDGRYQFRNRGSSDNFNRYSTNGGTRDKPGLTHVLYHEIDTGDKPPIVSRTYWYDRVKQGIIDYHLEKMLKEGTIIPIQSPYASPIVLCRKNYGLPPNNPEAYRIAVDYRKINAITKYSRYPLPLIEDLITNIPHTNIMSSLDLRSGYFQLEVKPSGVVKTAFVTKNGTFAFKRMPFGLSGAAPNFQKVMDIILKLVRRRFESIYIDDVIISSPPFAHHAEHLRKVFRLLQEARLKLNKDKCKFGCEKLKYLGLIISKDGITTDESKVKAIIEITPP
ncbi:retrovirus-related Pol polyprotein from transposon opus [Trichonephila clavipes]|nr:retrovirus-related Pol polyprotein from transposon opus [Trichonephila clavipes]